MNWEACSSTRGSIVWEKKLLTQFSFWLWSIDTQVYQCTHKCAPALHTAYVRTFRVVMGLVEYP